jgi:hypothetical protein
LPDLFKHFETLDITTDLFLIDWMLTLYSQQLSLPLVSRVWDNFFLDGEIFAIKTGLALLRYHESALTNQSYYKIISFLRGEAPRRSAIQVEEDRFFKVIEAIEIDKAEYYNDLKMQKWSY